MFSMGAHLNKQEQYIQILSVTNPDTQNCGERWLVLLTEMSDYYLLFHVNSFF